MPRTAKQKPNSVNGPTRAHSPSRCGLHLDGECALVGPFTELGFCFAVRGIGRPDFTRTDGPSSGDQLALEKRDQRRLAGDLLLWRQIVIRRSFVANRAAGNDEAR